jgi:hypothetical protein
MDRRHYFVLDLGVLPPIVVCLLSEFIWERPLGIRHQAHPVNSLFRTWGPVTVLPIFFSEDPKKEKAASSTRPRIPLDADEDWRTAK